MPIPLPLFVNQFCNSRWKVCHCLVLSIPFSFLCILQMSEIIHYLFFSLLFGLTWCPPISYTLLRAAWFNLFIHLHSINCVCTLQLLYPFTCHWSFGLFPYSGYCTESCNETGMHIHLELIFLCCGAWCQEVKSLEALTLSSLSDFLVCLVVYVPYFVFF